MSSLQSLRELISERLAAAAEEICRLCEGTIVQYEQELCRQRRLLDICWKPQLQLQQIELPQQYLHRDEETGNQEGNSCVEQEVQEPPQVKEERKELSISRNEKRMDLKQETEASEIPTYKENERSEADLNTQQTNNDPSRNRDHVQSMDRSHLLENQQDFNVGIKTLAQIQKFKQTPIKPTLPCKPFGESSRDCSSLSITHTFSVEKPFSCAECNQSFENKCKFLMHLKIHQGEKYSCKECNKSYRRSYVLRTHMRIHTGEKLFTCKHCDKSFINNCNLKIHMRTHTGEKPFSCDLCGKCFRHKSHLSIHTRTHTGEKPFTCRVCNKKFHKNSNLKIHMWTHSDHKPFPCNQCERSYSQKSNLRDHMRTHNVEGVQQNMTAAD